MISQMECGNLINELNYWHIEQIWLIITWLTYWTNSIGLGLISKHWSPTLCWSNSNLSINKMTLEHIDKIRSTTTWLRYSTIALTTVLPVMVLIKNNFANRFIPSLDKCTLSFRWIIRLSESVYDKENVEIFTSCRFRMTKAVPRFQNNRRMNGMRMEARN